MRYQGKIVKWFDAKGYGFIKEVDEDCQIFVHISAFPLGQSKPKVDELVSFEIEDGVKGKQAYNVQYVNRAKHVIRPTKFEKPENRKSYSSLIIMMIFAFLLLHLMSPKKSNVVETKVEPSQSFSLTSTQKSKNFHCSGKSECSEMTSCDEAIYYLNNCPETIMDGDGDGLPCEDQWCSHAIDY